MVRSRVMLVVLVMLCVDAAEAQQQAFTGMVGINAGAAQGGDIGERTISPSLSMVVVEESGLGAELDLGYTRDFAGDDFADSSIVSGMLNIIGMWTHPVMRPYASGGVGLMRMRASFFEGQPILSRTNTGLNAGGGLVVVFNETIGVRGDLRYFRYFERQLDVPLNTVGFAGFWRSSIGAVFSWPIR